MTRAKAALFLDRDGIVNVDHGYVHRIEDFQFVEGIFDLCRVAVSLGFDLVVVTNQAGIARGYYGEAEFHRLMEWLGRQFAERNLALLDYYFCPCHPDGQPPYRRRSFMRKPGPGMLLRAADDHGIDLSASLFIGDQPSDIEAGCRAGVGATIFYAPGGSDRDWNRDCAPDAVVRGHAEAADWLRDWCRRRESAEGRC